MHWDQGLWCCHATLGILFKGPFLLEIVCDLISSKKKNHKQKKNPDSNMQTQFLFLCKQQGSVCCKGRSPVDEQHGVSSAATHRWGWFPSFCSADESKILGLVSTEWGRSVLCHHWYVVWRRCGGQRRALWNNTPKHLIDTKPKTFLNCWKRSASTCSVQSIFILRWNLF